MAKIHTKTKFAQSQCVSVFAHCPNKLKQSNDNVSKATNGNKKRKSQITILRSNSIKKRKTKITKK